MPPQDAPAETLPAGPHGFPSAGREIVVPEPVRKAWKAVRIEVDYKERKERKAYVVPLDGTFRVPDSGLTLKTGAFLPHFTMGPGRITSDPARPENPAVRIEVLEDGREIFRGWLFVKHPDAHRFDHPAYGLTLLGGVRR